jgi:hypothetical protein
VNTAKVVTLALVAATAVALLTVRIQRTGPEQVVYSNLCGPTGDDLCYKPVLKGGFPVAYLFDAPGVSVEDQLAFFEDNFHPDAFGLDVALYLALILLGRWFVLRRRYASRDGTTTKGTENEA